VKLSLVLNIKCYSMSVSEAAVVVSKKTEKSVASPILTNKLSASFDESESARSSSPLSYR